MRARKIEGIEPAAALRPNASLILRTRLAEMRAIAEHALEAEAAAAQHDMRIAAKRLRYALEIFGPCLGEDADAARRAAKKLQTVLGDLHDCDLTLPKVDGIPSLRAALNERRARLFAHFVELWQSEASTSAWVSLEHSM